MAATRSNPKRLCLKALYLLMLPVVRFCLNHHLTLGDIIETLKRAMLAAGCDEIARSNSKVTGSRLSLVTGIHRNEIARLSKQSEELDDESQSIAERVLGYWVSNKKYSNSKGSGRPLGFIGGNSEFHSLVRSVSTNVNPASVLFELIRSGRIEKDEKVVKVIHSATQVGDDFVRAFEMVSKDLDVLIRAVEENLASRSETGNMHFHTVYDNVYLKDLPRLKQWLVEQGREFHRNLRAYLSGFDKDVNPDLDDGSPAGVKVSIMAVSFTEQPQVAASQGSPQDLAGSR